MSLPPIFSQQYYAHWREFEARHWWTAGMRDMAAGIIDLAKLPAEGVMLDVGCGSGQGMHWFSAIRPAWKKVGIDLGADGLRAAQGSGLTGLALATATSLPLVTEAVDLVITLDVLQHLPLRDGDRHALREMYRVLKPGGHLFIRTNVQSFPRVSADEDAVWHKYDVDELETKLRDAGFTVVRLSRVNAILGLAEIPSELRLAQGPRRHSSYDVVSSAPPRSGGLVNAAKRTMLGLEGRAVRAGFQFPFGRSLVALCRRD